MEETTNMPVDLTKKHGVHYTPPELATFLAKVTLEHSADTSRGLRILDPACGDGELLCAIACELPEPFLRVATFVGYERDSQALNEASQRLTALGAKRVELHPGDFLDSMEFPSNVVGLQQSLFSEAEAVADFDVVIANPPYVRTQVLGAKQAQALAARFGITGRVDLYHAFAIAMASVLKPGGVLGLLTSNRFLTIKSGSTLRSVLRNNFDLKSIFDLGDTKLFSAAVLPVIVVGTRQQSADSDGCEFDRVYEERGSNSESPHKCDSVLDALVSRSITGVIETPKGRFLIERGHLRPTPHDETWSLHTEQSGDWLSKIAATKACTFDDIAYVRVGIKTTADDVFIREDWSKSESFESPEGELLKPLITHHIAKRWTLPECPSKSILYPHSMLGGKRKPIDLAKYPAAADYFEANRNRLESRKYVIDAGRAWYEIWVPHTPTDWEKPKIVYPDISEDATFFLDRSGALVNGDCYWITLRDGVDEDWLYLMLAVANSSLGIQYYDTVFHNKLYAGRRRFMTQYVKSFPLPDLASKNGAKIVATVKQLCAGDDDNARLESKLNELIAKSFGVEEASRQR
jgi:adenine-specific DNA-methyltransferase